MGEPREGATAHPRNTRSGANAALRVLGADLSMAAAVSDDVDIVHSHTWYANMGGLLTALMLDVAHVVTSHSLEPHRPWKAEQLGGGYRVSSWAEKTAYEAADAVISVSEGMRRDVLESYPDLDPGEGARRAQRHRHRGVQARPGHRGAHRPGRRPRPPDRGLRRPDHPPEGPGPPRPRGKAKFDPDTSACPARRCPRHPGDRRRVRGGLCRPAARRPPR